MVDFYSGKKVLVTGDTGFKGSWLCEWLHLMGAEVLGVALPPANPQDHWIQANTGSRVKHIDLDIRDRGKVINTFREFRPEIVFHLAAQAIVRVSYESPVETFETNVIGSVNILDAIRLMDCVRSVVYVTSDKCYKNLEWSWGYREVDELGGHDPYSASKAAAELVFSSYRDSFFSKRGYLGTVSVRAGNVIGGGDWAVNRIIPDCIKALKSEEPIIVRSPDSIRPWQHVLEPLGGYMLAGMKAWENPVKFSGAWNFGPDAASIRSVKELVSNVISVWGSGSSLDKSDPNALHEAKNLMLSIEKARSELGWRPRWNFEESIQKTVSWYKAVEVNGIDAHQATIEDIHAYTRSIL